MRDELTREKRHRARAEAEARAARCELACVKAMVRVSDASVDDADETVVVADVESDALARSSSSSTSSDDDDVDGREVESSREEPTAEIATVARCVSAVVDGGTHDACLSGRDRLVPETGDGDEVRFYADVAEELDAETTHRHATLIAFELARVSSTTRMKSNDVMRHASMFFYKRHGSRALGELHRKMFFNALARRRAASEWAHVFARVLEDVDEFVFAHAMRMIRHVRFVLVESPDLDAAPIMSVDEGARALAFLLAPLSGKSSSTASKEFESIRRRATHVNGISQIPFAVVLERGIDAVHRAKESVRSALAQTFAKRHPDGTLAHHSTLVKTIADAVANVDVASTSVLTDDTDGFDRIALEIARRHASSDDFVALERFVDVAFDELIAMLLSRAATPDTEPAMRSARFKSKPNAMTIDVVGSLALVARAWDFASRVVDRRLAAWTSRDRLPSSSTTTTDTTTDTTFPIPPVLTTDVTKRALLRRRVDKLFKLRGAARFAVRAAASLARRVDATDDIARAWHTYAAFTCAFESTAHARRRVAGVVDAPLAAW